jgi:hypothetical protein
MIDPSLDTQDVTEQPLGCFMQGHWYLDPATKLMYIVPDERHGLAETHGPDDAILDALDRRYRDARTSSSDWFDLIPVESVADGLDLWFIAQPFRRFDPRLGYYSS